MRNLYRAIRLTFRYKYSIVASIFCAFMIGFLWGGNIGVLAYPIVDICFKKETFGIWIDRKIEDNCKSLETKRAEIISLERQQADSDDPKKRAQFDIMISREENALYWLDVHRWLLEKGKPWVDRFAPRDPFLTVVLLISFAVLGTLLKAAFTILQTIISAHIAQSTIYSIRNQFFDKAILYDVNYFSQKGVAETMSRFTGDTGSLSSGLMLLYGKLIREPLKLVACLVGAALISMPLLILTLLLVPIAALAIRWLARSLKRVVRRGMEQMVRMFARLEESFRSIRIVKAFGRERYEKGKFRQANRNYYLISMKTTKYDSLTHPLVEILGVLMICVGVLLGSYLVMNERTELWGIPISSTPISQPMLLTFFLLLAGAADPARKLSDIFTQFQTAYVAADRVFEMIDRPVAITDVPEPALLSRHKESIVFDRVSFEYEPGRPILKEVSLEIRFGETLGIVGPSGCGKSTLISLIPRFADPCSGEIRIDDHAIKGVKMRDLRGMMGIVTQEPILLNMSVFENLKYANPFASEEEVYEAARNAFAHDFIVEELPHGYETVVGPGGGQLSGGQRQRIALARAFLRDPAIFLLDEATSQIDLYSEQKIHEALATFVGKRTTILVTHRLSALKLADRIVVMRDGEIENVGTHRELMEKSPYYARLQQIEQE